MKDLEHYNTIIIGAGVSGLTVGKKLKNNFKIIEEKNICGGLSGQYSDNGHDFDYGGHYFHFQNKEIIFNYIKKYSRFKKYLKNSKVFVLSKFIPFPIQFHLSFFPDHLKKNLLKEIMADNENLNPKNLEEYLMNTFGKSLYKIFFQPFLSKYYNMDLKDLIHSMDKGSIPVPDKEEIIDGYNGKKFTGLGYNPVFYYPEISLNHFINNYAEDIQSNIIYNEEVIKIDINNKTLFTKNQKYSYDTLINTMPLKEFLKKSDNSIVEKKKIEKLKNISTVVTNVVLNKRRKRFHWIYLPDNKYPFYRFGYYPGTKKISGYLERTVTDGSKIATDGIIKSVYLTLKDLGVVNNKDEIKFISNKYIPVSYIIFDKEWNNIVPETLKKLKEKNIYSIGRYGSWDYTSMSDDISNALKVAEEINFGL